MIHYFDVDHATEYGIEGAILISNLQFWIMRNRANGENFREGRTWTYNSVKAFKELFPYMSIGQVRRNLEKLVECGVLLTANHNESACDRTLWYAFSDESIFLAGQNHLAKTTNGSGKRGKSLKGADRNPDGNPDSRRGTRLPEDWQLKQETLEWTLAKTAEWADGLPEWKGGAWTAPHTQFEAEKFRDYWTGKSGKDASKTDWPATWRNWVRNAGPMAAGGGKKGGGAPWWQSQDTKLAKAIEVGVGPANPGEPDSAWQARIQAAIDNGGKPPERTRPLQAVTIRDPLAGEEGKAKVSPEHIAAVRAAAGIRRPLPDNDQSQQVPA